MSKLSQWFSSQARKTAHHAGAWYSFATAFLIILLWAVTGPICKFSDTWQLVINTLTTLITFLMVFLIQATQNHDSMAIHLKLDEIIMALQRADNRYVDAQKCSDEGLQQLSEHHQVRKQTGQDPSTS
jgi:low affinity Fe/Cu permease